MYRKAERGVPPNSGDWYLCLLDDGRKVDICFDIQNGYMDRNLNLYAEEEILEHYPETWLPD